MSADQDRDVCELAVKKTLAYRSIFKYPLSLFQLKTFLISGQKIKSKSLSEAIKHLINRKFIKKKNGKYFLPGVNPVNWDEKKKLTEKLFRKNIDALKLISKVPWVRMVCVTGSAAAYNASNESDMDVFIIASKNRVWITRFFVTLILKIIGKFPQTEGEPGKICTNLYLEEKHMSWPEEKRNIFVAHDIVMMQPVFDSKQTYFKFLNANKWVSEYFPNFYINQMSLEKNKRQLTSPLVDFVEDRFMKIQLRHMKRKQTTETTTKHLIHFKKNDNSQKIISAYESVIKNRNIS